MMAAKRIENQGDSDFGSASLKVIGTEEIRGGKRVVARVRGDELAYIEPLTEKAGTFRLRRIGWLERWRDTDKITTAEFEAAQRFEADYAAAHTTPKYSAAAMEWIDRGNSDDTAAVKIAKRVNAARARLKRDYEFLGLRGSVVADRILGQGLGLREFARWSCRTGNDINDQTAKGMLMAALSTLARSRGLR